MVNVDERDAGSWSQSPACKVSEELKHTMNVLGKHSENFFEKKINHYDNQVRKNQESIYNKLNLKANSNSPSQSPVDKFKPKAAT